MIVVRLECLTYTMGIYDRDYERDHGYGSSPGYHLGGSLTWTTKLVIVMGLVYAVQLLTQPARAARPNDAGWFTEMFALHADLFRRPWLAFELVTYGFLHSVTDIKHILFNALALWMFGRSVEQRYGSREYLTFYFTAVVFAGLFWIVGELLANGEMLPLTMLGASGGIAGVLLLFCLNFPHQQVFVWGVFPLPAWVFAIFFVGLDIMGAVGRQSPVAFTAHLGGALLALVYFFGHWRLSRWLPAAGQWKMPKMGRRPPLRVVDPDTMEDESTDDEVDDILRKIREHGQDSLTRRERRILEQASREYQKRRS